MFSDDVSKILRDVRNLLSFHKNIGIADYPRTEDLADFLSSDKARQGKIVSYPPPDHSSVPAADRQAGVEGKPAEVLHHEMRQELENCQRCGLHAGRSTLVIGEGNCRADLVIIGEWPNTEDDTNGKPFSGEPGVLLAKMLKAINLVRQDVFITNLVMCHPAENRSPTTEELQTCLPFLKRTIAIVSPKVICTFGPLAAQVLLKTSKPLIRLRGRFHDFQSIPLMPTFHPAFLLKNEEFKKPVWQDLQMIQKKLASSAK